MKQIVALQFFFFAFLCFGQTAFCDSYQNYSENLAVEDGVSCYSAVKGDDDGFAAAYIIDVDLEKTDIFPALAKPSENLLESVVHFFTPWAKKSRPGFFKAKVSDIGVQNNALACVNGTYFSSNGEPLGVLMIDGRLISYPISDRTALVITKDRKAYIDNITMDAYFKVGEIKYAITGINEPRDSQEDMILYTADFGELTKTNGTGFDMVVENGIIASTRSGNTWIPENGFVVSAGALYAENLPLTVKKGDKVEVVVNIIPYSTSVRGELLHLIGGGPRLLKSGRIYISKYEENFRRDIARGRSARTACGITQENHLLFVAVDGKPRGRNRFNGGSRGMTLTELAYFMQSLGAVDALNLDGGGSSTMVISGTVVNHPVGGSQRKVNNAILIKPRG